MVPPVHCEATVLNEKSKTRVFNDYCISRDQSDQVQHERYGEAKSDPLPLQHERKRAVSKTRQSGHASESLHRCRVRGTRRLQVTHRVYNNRRGHWTSVREILKAVDCDQIEYTR